MLELIPSQALNLVEMAVAGFIGRVIRVLITLKMARHIKSAVLIISSLFLEFGGDLICTSSFGLLVEW